MAYDHFKTRSRLLVELIRWIDTARVDAFREAMVDADSAEEVVDALAVAYITCAADTQGEFYAVGSALAGSDEKATVYRELIENYVGMFVDVLAAYSTLDRADLERRCIGLVGGGEALALAQMRGELEDREASNTFAALIRGAIDAG